VHVEQLFHALLPLRLKNAYARACPELAEGMTPDFAVPTARIMDARFVELLIGNTAGWPAFGFAAITTAEGAHPCVLCKGGYPGRLGLERIPDLPFAKTSG
jgi:hypothetical protein